jgi:hypothetical protein
MSDEANERDLWQSRAEVAETALARIREETATRLIRAELKAEALRAGMVDLDGLKLLNMEDIKLSDAGEIENAADHLQKLKRAKPWLFSNLASSSSATNPPRPEPARVRQANELSHEEWVSARAALIRRR